MGELTMIERMKRPLVAALVLALAAPAPMAALAQNVADTGAELRLRKVEAEVRALQTKVFPGSDGKFFPAQVQPGQAVNAATGVPASTPISDLLGRVDAVEAQLARLTAQSEENANKLAKLEERLNVLAPIVVAPASTPVAIASTPVEIENQPAAIKPAASVPVAAVTVPRVVTAPPPKTVSPTKPATATAQRTAAVRAVVKPATSDPADDEYSYGFRLWEAKFYPEAQQQLKLYLDKYPRHSRLSYARNLLGRAFLDDGKADEAARWFLANYQASKSGDRAPDSLLFLAETMRLRKDTNRACVALAQFVDDYPQEAVGRLKAQYDKTRAGVKCN